MRTIQGKTALVTGGSRGLGRVIALSLAREGVNLALTARNADALKAAAKDCAAYGVRTEVYPGDIALQADREALLEKVTADFGGIDILINNAGVEWVSAYTALTTDDIESMIQVNLIAPMLLTRMILPDMLSRGSGHIVNMSSLGGKKGSPYSVTYAATKAGLIQWTHGLRVELANTGVDLSVICPGFVSDSGMFAAYNKRAPKIVGESRPEEVAEATIRALRKNIGEIVVNPGPIKPMMLLDVIHPGIGRWILGAFGVYEFYRRQAEENEAQRSRG